jgi:hypothetical protein
MGSHHWVHRWPCPRYAHTGCQVSEEYFKSLVRSEEAEATKIKNFLNTRMDKVRHPSRRYTSTSRRQRGPMQGPKTGGTSVARAQVHAFIRHHWIREASRQRYLDFCAFMEDELQQCAALCQPTRRLSPRCGTAAAFAFVRAPCSASGTVPTSVRCTVWCAWGRYLRGRPRALAGTRPR